MYKGSCSSKTCSKGVACNVQSVETHDGQIMVHLVHRLCELFITQVSICWISNIGHVPIFIVIIIVVI